MSASISGAPARGRRPAGAVCALLLALLGIVAASPAQAGVPSTTGCPASGDGNTATGWQVLSVSDLLQQGYHVPAQIDAAGNGDGYVCGRPINDVQAARICGGPCQVPVLYLFADNDNTPTFHTTS